MKRLISLFTICLFLWLANTIFGAHPFDVPLYDADGNSVQGGTNTPYSPKRTCGLCHPYETSNILYANKDHGPDSYSYPGENSGGMSGYNVLYPEHGISAGFHFQQGRSTPWGDIQRDYYKLASFTSSPGMYGKY